MAENADIPSKPIAKAIIPIELDTTRADEQLDAMAARFGEMLGRAVTEAADQAKPDQERTNQTVAAMGEGVPFAAPGGGMPNEFRPSVEGQSYDRNHREIITKLDEVLDALVALIQVTQEQR